MQLVFLVGVIFQCLLMTRHLIDRKYLKNILLMLGGAFVLTLLGLAEKNLVFDFVVAWGLLFAFIFIIVNRKEIISFLDERVFVLLNLLLIYFLILASSNVYNLVILGAGILVFIVYVSMRLTHSNKTISGLIFVFGFMVLMVLFFAVPIINFLPIEHTYLLPLAILVPIIFLIITFPKKVNSKVLQGSSYLWHLIILLVLEFFALKEIYFGFMSGEIFSPYLYFFIGASSVYFIVLIFNIILSLPLIGEDTPLKESMKTVYESITLFSEKYHDFQIPYLEFALVFAVSLLVFWVHYFMKFISIQEFILILMPILIILFRIRKNKSIE
jgi:hypothetical protein